MLATIGFFIAAIIFIVYGYTLYKLKNKNFKDNITLFTLAYILLGVACVTWALGAIIGTDSSLKTCVFMGNISVIAATIVIINSVWGNKYRVLLNTLLVVISACLLVLRNLLIPPEPFMKDGVLVFNTQTIVLLAFAIIFIGIWMPINLRVSRQITKNIRLLPMQAIGEIAFVLASFGVVGFIAAQKPLTVALSFIILCSAFIPLTFINYLALRDK